MVRDYLTIIGIICLVNLLLSAQSVLPSFEFITTDHGLPKRGVTSITPDDSGFVWVGMHGAGLHKYDGTNYTSYSYDFEDSTSINSNVVHAIYKDSRGQLWVGSDGGLNKYNRSLNCFINIPFHKDNHTTNDQVIILDIIENDQGQIYVGSNYNGLFEVNPTTLQVKKIKYQGIHQDQLPLHILNFAKSSSGNIYLATNLGLKMINPDKNSITDAIIHTKSGQQTLDIPLQFLMIDDLNNLWIGSQQNGIFKTACLHSNEVSLRYLEQFDVTERRVMSMAQSKSGDIYCGTENDGLFILDLNGKVLQEMRYQREQKKGLKSNSVWKVHFDAEDRLWVGYYDKGIDISDPQYRKFNALSNLSKHASILDHISVTGLVSDQQGNLWLATDGSGVYYLDYTNKRITPYLNDIYPNNTGAAIQSIFIDSQENVWAGGWNEGVFLLRKGEKEFVNFTTSNTSGALLTNRIISFAEDSKGKIWLATWGKGFFSFDPTLQTFKHYNSPEIQQYGLHVNDIRKILIDEADQLWIGSTKGLFKIIFDEQNTIKELVAYRDIWKDQFDLKANFNNVHALYKSTANELWIGTEGAGLLRYQIDQDTLYQYYDKNGFAQQTTSAIIEATPGQIWVSGRSGISHIDTKSGEIENYDEADGLISNDFNYNSVMKDHQGHLYFGNVMGGVNYFNPDSIAINQSNIKVYLTQLKIFNKEVVVGEKGSPLEKTLEVTDQITLTHLQSVFTIEYTGINFTHAERNQFAYYLEGLEDDWNYVGQKRSATYTSLASGDYIFKLKAANNDGLWNEEPVTLKITVLPPWWRSNTGYFVYILLFLGALYIFYRMMRMRVLAKEEIQNERQRRAQEQELNKNKLQFFTNISHEFRTPLTLIVNPLEDILNHNSNDLPDEVEAKHLIIHKNAKRLERLINELMDFRKLSFKKLKVRVRKTEIVHFIHNIAEYFQGEAIDKGIDFKVQAAISSMYIWVDSGLIEKVLFNLLSNAFKVTNAGGTISILLDTTKQVFPELNTTTPQAALSITISDTGPGLSPEHIQHIFERFYQIDNLNKAYYGGTGIGLEVVNNFIKLHKGKIEVESELEVGTNFIVHLPIGDNYFSEEQIATPQKVTNQAISGVQKVIKLSEAAEEKKNKSQHLNEDKN
ncbi:MAG: two-component regulator propeller domain-containing protein, partial [Bacteroidota bacterium]